MSNDQTPTPAAESATQVVPCRVVGVGASAGGIEAVSQLLHDLPAEVGVALIVVLHLDPTHASSLVDVLARSTKFVVESATTDAAIEAGHAYVIPPNTRLIVENGRLRLLPRPEAPVSNMPVDQLFASLAGELKERAIGVVLSGTGNDGAAGVQAIKQAGGLTFAQDETARFDGMPRSAIATHCVDAVLPPSQIATELARVCEGPTETRIQPPVTDAEDLKRVFVALRESTGVDFSGYKPSTLRRRIGRRIAFNRLATLADYQAFIEHNPVELKALYEDLLINVTGFFRDPGLFEALRSRIFPKLMEGRASDSPIRVWVPGCSSGEEVYSLAICILEYLSASGLEHPVRLFGTDVSDAAIMRARSGVYSEISAADLGSERLKRFFVPTEGGYQIRPDIRDMCVFARQDVTSDPPFSNMDLVSCRNLLIYLGQGLQSRVIAVLHYALKSSGYLILGASEGISTFPGFTLIDGKNRIFAKAPGGSRLMMLDFPGHSAAAGRQAAAQTAPLANHADVNREADRAILARYGVPAVVVTEDMTIVQFRGQTGPFLDPLPGVASLDLFKMAREEIRMDIRAAIDEARQRGEPVQRSGLWMKSADGMQLTDIEVLPVRVPVDGQKVFVILLRTRPIAPSDAVPPAATPEPASRSVEMELRRELGSTREYMRSLIEQLEAGNEELRAANEEVVSSNEELLSTNEELQLAKEELQATNEELATVNEEILERNVEATRINTDLINVLSSAAIPIVLLGRDARIRRFTPSAGKLLNLIATDIGRPITDLKSKLHLPDFTAIVTEVLATSTPFRREVRDDTGHWYECVVRPYVTFDEQKDGAVVSVLDIDAIKTSHIAVAQARGYAETIVDTVRDWLLVLDENLRVRSTNKALLAALRATSEQTIGHSVFELGNRAWDVPALHQLLEQAVRGTGKIADVEIELDVPDAGRRIVAVNGHRLQGQGDQTKNVLLAFHDVTDKVRFAQNQEIHERKLRQLAFDSAVAEEHERRRIAENLHDGIGQALALTEIKLATLQKALGPGSTKDLEDCLGLVRQSIADARTLTFELSPPILYDLGIEAAVSWLADQMREKHGLDVRIEDDGKPKKMDDTVAAMLFRAIRELLMNVLKHARVSNARISMRREGDELTVDVIDNGVGFDIEQSPSGAGFGLFSVREQLTRLGGRLDVTSVPRGGTRSTLRMPLGATATKDGGDATPAGR